MKKIISLILVFSLMIGLGSVVYGADFKDVKNTNWAYESVKAMSGKNIIKGYPDGSFKPSNTVTYAEFIKMVVVAATGEELELAPAPNHWSQNYYDKAIELGYFNEHQIKTYQLGLEIPRGDMALIISSILGDIKIENYSDLQKEIKDVTPVTKHEYDITKTYYAGVLTGYTDKTFKPEQTLSRAESASVIHRLVDESKRVPIGTKEEVKTKTVTLDYGYRTETVVSEDVKLGDKGIVKFDISPTSGWVRAYSTVCYDAINIYVNNQYVSPVGFKTGLNYDYDGEYYIYVFNPARANIDVKGKTPSILFENGKVHRYTDVIL